MAREPNPGHGLAEALGHVGLFDALEPGLSVLDGAREERVEDALLEAMFKTTLTCFDNGVHKRLDEEV